MGSQPILDFLQRAGVAGTQEGIGLQHAQRELALLLQQWVHRRRRRGLAAQGLIQHLELLEIPLGVPVRFDALDPVIDRGDVRQPGQRHHKWQRWQRVEIPLQPEVPQGDVGDVEDHPGQVRGGQQSDRLVPSAPGAPTGGSG